MINNRKLLSATIITVVAVSGAAVLAQSGPPQGSGETGRVGPGVGRGAGSDPSDPARGERRGPGSSLDRDDPERAGALGGKSPSSDDQRPSVGRNPRSDDVSGGQAGTNTRGGPSSGGAASIDLTPQQRTDIHKFLVTRQQPPKETGVTFPLTIGTRVPEEFRASPIPAEVTQLRPSWREHRYFMVGDQVVIIGGDREIVALIS